MSKFFDAYKKYIVNHPKRLEYKPTSVKFDADSLRKINDKVDKSITCLPADMEAIDQFVSFSSHLHKMYEYLYKIIDNNYANLNLKGIDIAEYLVAALNRDYKVVWNKRKDIMESTPKGAYLLSDMMNFKIQSCDPKIGYMDARAAFESETDCINLLLNYLRFFKDKEFTSPDYDPSRFASNIIHSIQCSQIAVVLKHSYDDILYNGGFVSIDYDTKTITFDYENYHRLKLLLAGDMMFAERRIQTWSRARELKKPSRLLKYTTRFRIKKATVSQSCIKLDFSQGKRMMYESVLTDIQAALDGYYEFLDGDTVLPSLADATMDEVIAIWCAIQYICLYVLDNVNYDVSLFKREDFSVIPSKIVKADLINYVNKLTGIKPIKVKATVEAMEADWKKYNDIWTAMLYPVGEYLLLPFFPIIYSAPYNVIDRLLQKGGLSLDERGKQFENFLYTKLTQNKSSFPIKCLPTGKYGGAGNMEEIDILISTKNCLLIADAKCIHYSMEPINYAEAWDRLKEGCEQSIRKAEFVKKNSQFFPQLGDYSQKKIIPFVVTNYPTFTGLSYNNTSLKFNLCR